MCPDDPSPDHPSTPPDPLTPDVDLLIVWHSRTGAAAQLAWAAFEGAAQGRMDASIGAWADAERPHLRWPGDGPPPGTADLRTAGAGRPVVRRLHCTMAGGRDLLAARACLFVCPENLATMSGEMKAFFDRSYYEALDRIAGRACATIIAAGSDGQGAAAQIARICQGWRLRAAAEPMIVPTRAQTPQEILAAKTIDADAWRAAADLGQALAEGAALGVL